jgi:hypothetical protein
VPGRGTVLSGTTLLSLSHHASPSLRGFVKVATPARIEEGTVKKRTRRGCHINFVPNCSRRSRGRSLVRVSSSALLSFALEAIRVAELGRTFC